jgi:YbgC/YbaW family acyl-CoA thioester hydrolase
LKKFSTNVRVRYGETDQMGVVYHGNYASYFEIARTEWLRNLVRKVVIKNIPFLMTRYLRNNY